VRSFPGFRIFLLILGLCCFSHFSHAQSSDQAQIRGTVSDSSGAVIPHAGVTLTDIGTNVSQKTVSSDHGLYVFTALPASSYRMLIEAPGFGPVEKPGIVLTVNQETTLNVTLAPAAANANVTVESVPVLLDADNATLGTDIGEKYLTPIPSDSSSSPPASLKARAPVSTTHIPREQISFPMGKEIPLPKFASTAR
jgi:hypothetical protein